MRGIATIVGSMNVRATVIEVDTVSADVTAPAQVTDFALDSQTVDDALLSWTVSGDDGATGRAALYDIRYANATINDEAKWTAAYSPLGGWHVVDVDGGAVASLIVQHPGDPGTYYYALRYRDEAGNMGALSNVVTIVWA